MPFISSCDSLSLTDPGAACFPRALCEHTQEGAMNFQSTIPLVTACGPVSIRHTMPPQCQAGDLPKVAPGPGGICGCYR